MNELSLASVAQTIMDMFYEGLKAEEDFFELDHFIFCARAAYSKLIEAEAKEARALARSENGFATINLTQDWLVSETVSFTKKHGNNLVAELKQQPFAFPYDIMGFGVQSVQPVDGDGQFIRTSPDEAWKYRHIPATSRIFFTTRGNKIILANVTGAVTLHNVEVWYAPALTGDPELCTMSAAKHLDVINLSIIAMKQAAQGVIINTSNDQNPNTIIESEINKAQIK